MTDAAERRVSIVGPADDALLEQAQETPADNGRAMPAREVRPATSPRRRLSPEQERQVARLYAEAGTPTSEIRQRFGIGESSLYRIVQRQGIPLRRRGAASTQPSPSRTSPSNGRRRGLSRATDTQAARSQPRSTAATTTRSRLGAARRGPRGAITRSPARVAGRPSDGVGRRFRIGFHGEIVVEAHNIWDAVRQAEVLGATEIASVSREA